MIFFWSASHQKPGGGGFHFLAQLKTELLKKPYATENPEKADSILVDSYHDLLSALWHKLAHPHVYFIFRFGPIFSLHRSWYWRYIDQVMLLTANHFADFIIFQSQWSYQQAKRLGFKNKIPHECILNGVDTTVFHPTKKVSQIKPRLIATSWSANPNKGFSILRYLDEHLDWEKYDMTFIGNTPIKFQHIQIMSALPPAQLAHQLQQHDIYIAAMKNDACSNALLEAAACGLPIMALNSGSNSELLSSDDRLFESAEELVHILTTFPLSPSKDFTHSIERAAKSYQNAFASTRTTPARHVSLWYYLSALWLYLLFYVFQHLSSPSTRRTA